MLCEFQRVIYPLVPSPGSYMVALYHPCEQVKDLAGNVMEQIKAVGYCLPTAENLRFDMQGRWKTNAKFRDVDGITIRVNFGDGREVEYDTDQLSMLDLGYASTVHKSQGSEYQSVIVNLQKTHYIMLTRPLVYTAITRGKSRVIMVGEKRALHIAISRTDTEKRGTCLAKRIKNQ